MEIYRNGTWQSVCDEDWDIEDADVVCRQLNYGYAESAPTSSFYGLSFNDIWEVSIQCNGDESTLQSCNYMNVTTFCHSGEEAGARCSNEGISACSVHPCKLAIRTNH